MQRYGGNFVIYHSKAGFDCFSVDEILKEYRDWYGDKRQKERFRRDIEAIKSLPYGKYSFTTRQYTGHKRIPGKMREGERVFYSEAVDWGN